MRDRTPAGNERKSRMCTALLYRDANGKAYAGRTLELPMEMPY
jgi:penicillin V acylase-like amidase (Ntn superfamily)